MANGIDPNDPAGSRVEVSETGGLPPDFFERPDPVAPAEPKPTLDDAAPLPPRRPAGSASPGPTPRRAVWPIVAAILLGNVVFFLSGVLTGWSLTHRVRLPTNEKPGPDPMIPFLTRSIEGKANRAEVDRLQSITNDLQRQLRQLGGRLNALPAPPPAPDLGPLRARLDKLEQQGPRLAALPGQVDGLSDRVGTIDEKLGSLDETIATLRDELAALREPAPKPEEKPPAAPAQPPPQPQPRPASWAGEPALALYRAGQFDRARDAFLELAKNQPNDPRLWYYAALANGQFTHDWRGQTEQFVRHGIELEQTGTLDRAVIDAQLAGLPKELDQWLKFYRDKLPRP